MEDLIGLLLFWPPHLPILVLKTPKINELARTVMGTIFLVYTSPIFNCTDLRVSRWLRSPANYRQNVNESTTVFSLRSLRALSIMSVCRLPVLN